MEGRLHLNILPQPDETTCGPTCLHAVYGYFGDDVPLERLIEDVPRLDEGGTLAALLGAHALRRGYDATLYTFDLRTFDPTWFPADPKIVSQKLLAQKEVKPWPKLQQATDAYLEFLEHGGVIRLEDLTAGLISRHLRKSVPVLTGLSSTFLYREAREHAKGDSQDAPIQFGRDDVRGEPQGHFVVLCGYDGKEREVLVADPYLHHPIADGQHYIVGIDRVACAILLGILTYDANLLIIKPRKNRKR